MAQRQHVLHIVDPLALAHLGDVHESVTAGEDVDERTELGDGHHFAHVHGTVLHLRRIEDQLDTATGFGNGGAVHGTNGHGANHAIVVDRDVGAGLLLDLVDDLALGPDDLPDLVHGDLEADDLRCRLVDLGTRLGDGGVHDLQNC